MELESCVPTERWATLPLMSPQLWRIGKQPVPPALPPAPAHLLFFCTWILDDVGTKLILVPVGPPPPADSHRRPLSGTPWTVNTVSYVEENNFCFLKMHFEIV